MWHHQCAWRCARVRQGRSLLQRASSLRLLDQGDCENRRYKGKMGSHFHITKSLTEERRFEPRLKAGEQVSLAIMRDK